jgi:hypothetical protein
MATLSAVPACLMRRTPAWGLSCWITSVPKSLSRVMSTRRSENANARTSSSPGSTPPLSGPNDVVSDRCNLLGEVIREAAVDEQFHRPERFLCQGELTVVKSRSIAHSLTIIGSTYSSPTTREAYSRQARTSSISSHSYSRTRSSGLSPAASMSRTCSTASRWPRTIALPP